MGIWRLLKRKVRQRGYDSTTAYTRYLNSRLKARKGDRELAFAEAIGATSMELFREQGDGHVRVLKHHGLADGMAVFDLGCGCGRTAQALQRNGWSGTYTGTDVVDGLIGELREKCPTYEAYVHRQPTIRAASGTIDMLYHWSVFTHLSVEECFLYMEDSFRALKPGGKLIFSFLEINEPLHGVVFDNRVETLRRGNQNPLLDTFLHRDWITLWAKRIGFTSPRFTDGDDDTQHGAFWQTLVAMEKPGS
ncbi:class I SAM-dependent methyltransferase [Sphingobium sp. 3R8]|uniref:class I SAM-dependent methyltransferase n=1 Tax=Sphingobium sp. 3R8 TaxID=2874921 RepID=UPI001CCCC1A7|nr:class I SAM-dependent methyltransferase [Sphingobium sp. 3R8]MBZ9647035.1 class I SAM-dependent methyltransferase [Sphingobium sp. 3R8]